MNGFDWLNIPPSASPATASASPAPAPPPVSFQSPPPQPTYHFANSSADHLPTEVDESIPLSLQARDLTLEESKTYMRWYSDILARTNSRTVLMEDVFQFLNNFKISNDNKDHILRIFHKISHSINIGEFFALLRLVSHVLQGQPPLRRLIRVQASVPTPPLILSKKRQVEETSVPLPSDKPLDIDSFTQFMLTGQRPGDKALKKQKSVKFSDQVVTDVHSNNYTPSPGQGLDFSLPMDQLLTRLQSSSDSLQVPQANLRVASPDEEEKQILRDMEPQINHFHNLNSVDTASIDGVPARLQPNMTGPAQMAHMFSPLPEPEANHLLQPNMTGPAQVSQLMEESPTPLKPNATGPLDMARMFQPPESGHPPTFSLSSFSDQMTGPTHENTLHNTHVTSLPDSLGSWLLPPPVPSTRRSRSVSSPTPRVSSPLANDSLSIPTRLENNTSPLRGPPPPPPARRRGGSNAPPPLPPKVSLANNQADTQIPTAQLNNPYLADSSNNSTANILDDLKALQEEVDKIRDMTGGF